MASITILTITIISLFTLSSAEICSNKTFSSNRVFNLCADLPFQGAHLHWTYNSSTKKVTIAYRVEQVSQGWIAWAINPTGSGMIGSQALVAFQNDNASMTVFPTAITSYNPDMKPSNLSFQVSDVSAEYSNNEMMIFAIIGPLERNVVNYTWQTGSSVSEGVPQIHPTSPPNLQSMGSIDFQSSSKQV